MDFSFTFWILPLSELTLFTTRTMAEPSALVQEIVFVCIFILIHIVCISSQFCRSWTGVVIAISMAASWLLAVVLVRIPTTRRICLNDARDLTRLCWAFCVFWVAAISYYDREAVETWSGKFAAVTPEMPTNIMHTIDVPKKFAIYFCATLAWAVEFMVMLSFWGDLKWKRPIVTVGCLVSGTLEKALHHLIPNEDDV
jgi:hypothetical protein